MIHSVEKHRRHLCIGQSIQPSQWPKDVKNLSGGYLKELTRIFEERKDAIGYSIKLTSASVPSTSHSDETADWYLFPDQLKLSNVNIKQIGEVVEKLFVNDQTKNIEEHRLLPDFQGDIQCERLNGLWILVCCHQERDQRCGMFEGTCAENIISKVQCKNMRVIACLCLKNRTLRVTILQKIYHRL